MKKFMSVILGVFLISCMNAQWSVDYLHTAGSGLAGIGVADEAVFTNGTEWNIFDVSTGDHTFGNLAVSRSMFEVVAAGEKVYIGGGKYGSFADPQYTKTVDVYDNATDTWSTLNLKVQREVGGSGTIGNKVFFAGGTGRSDISGPVYMYNTVDIFDVTTNARTTGKLSQKRSNIAVGAAANKIVFAGGWYWNPYYMTVQSNRADIYDVTTGVWTRYTLSAKREDMAVAVIGNKIIFAGGWGVAGPTNKVDIYDAATNVWTTGNLSLARYAMQSTVIGDQAFFAGGVGGGNTIEVYNATMNSWSTISIPTTVTRFDMTSLNDELYIAGGLDAANVETDLVQIYNTLSGTWSNAYLSEARYDISTISVANHVLFAGGINGYVYPTYTTTTTVDIYAAPLRLAAMSDSEAQELDITIFPNPTNRQITIHADMYNLPANMIIYDLNGQAIMQIILMNEETVIDVAGFPAGMYLIAATDNRGNVYQTKFSKY
jgi:hypothetical protein